MQISSLALNSTIGQPLVAKDRSSLQPSSNSLMTSSADLALEEAIRFGKLPGKSRLKWIVIPTAVLGTFFLTATRGLFFHSNSQTQPSALQNRMVTDQDVHRAENRVISLALSAGDQSFVESVDRVHNYLEYESDRLPEGLNGIHTPFDTLVAEFKAALYENKLEKLTPKQAYRFTDDTPPKESQKQAFTQYWRSYDRLVELLIAMKNENDAFQPNEEFDALLRNAINPAFAIRADIHLAVATLKETKDALERNGEKFHSIWDHEYNFKGL